MVKSSLMPVRTSHRKGKDGCCSKLHDLHGIEGNPGGGTIAVTLEIVGSA
jgi:hypothetical protein